jgi:beta-ketoacyl ACP reductase
MMVQRTALVIGASLDIASAVGQALVAGGHRVAVTHGDTCPSEFFEVRCDLADAASIEAAFDKVEDALGAVEILVVDAGVLRDPQLRVAAQADPIKAVRKGLRAVDVAASRAREAMRRARWGRIVLLGSTMALIDDSGAARYAGLSFNVGLNGFAETLAYELASDNVTVNVVAPGVIEGDEQNELDRATRMDPLWSVPAERAGRLDEIAAPVAFLASEGAGYITGTTLRVDGGRGILPGATNRF